MKIQFIYLWAIVFILLGCKSTTSIPAESNSNISSKNDSTEVSTDKLENYLAISFQQTACFGSCPVHKLNIFSSGYGNYHGDRNVRNKGDYRADFTKRQIQEIINKADSLNFFDLEDKYSANVTDLPTTIIYINDGKRKKKVVAYANYPANLKTLITYLYDFSQSVDWQEEENE